MFRPTVAFTAVIAASLAACGGGLSGPLTPASSATVVLDVVPGAGATGVSPSGAIVIRFNHPMMAAMDPLVALHKGTVTGPEVPGAFAWSADGTQLTFTPGEQLESKTTYVLHLSPNLTDALGNRLDFGACARSVGGQPVSSGMMPGGMMGGGWPGTMGPGWQAGSGTWGYGMIFTFTTA